MNKARRAGSILAVALSICACMAISGCEDVGTTEVSLNPTVSDDALVSSETLTVGVDTSQPPFASIVTAEAEEDEASTNEIVGFDVDAASALADELGLKLDVIDISDSTAEDALENGEVDVVMSASTTSTVGIEVFVGPYVDNSPAVFALEGTSSDSFDPESLTDCTVGAYAGSVASTDAMQYCGTDNLVEYDSVEEMFQALQDGEVDYVAADMVSGGYVSTLYSGVECIGVLGSSNGCYMAVQESNSELSEALSGALETIDSNGVLDIVISKWCGDTTVDFASPDIQSDDEESEGSEE